jgi:hypothetical protein
MHTRGGWLALGLACAATASAEVVNVEVASRTDVADGAAYGEAGGYEALAGKIRFAVDPEAAVNRIVADIEFAPTNAAGQVEFQADFYLLKPKDIERGNGALLFEVANRGRKGALPMLSHASPSLVPASAAELGDGFLLTQGFTLLWVGWQFDPPDDPSLLRLYAPATTDRGAPLKGRVRSDFVVRERVFDHSLADGGHVAYSVADPASTTSVLTVRDRPLDAREVVPRAAWRFARSDGDGGNVRDDPTHVYLKAGFEPHRIYEVVYESQNPRVAGLGLAAIRDAVGRLKHEGAAELGIPSGSIDRAIAFGISQSGRVLRTFIYDGFNEDERHRKVFDGVMAHIAGGARGSFNHRFAQPSRASWSFFYPNELFPFTDTVQIDPETGRSDGLLARVDDAHVPKIFYTNSSNEYWRGSAALTHVTPDGERDVPPGASTRIYHLAGTQHVPAAFPPRRTNGQLPSNTNDYSWFLRALLLKMDRWITKDVAPPPSRYPTLRAGTLVARSALRFPDIPAVVVPERLQPVVRLDYGPRFAAKRIIDKEPPAVGDAFPLLLPQVDADGNEIDGLRSPELAVPLATYTGWSLFDAAFGPPDELVSLQGSYHPLPLDAAERELARDPRRSIRERYRDRDHYLELIAEEARGLIEREYLLAEDLAAILGQAEQRWDAIVERR